jgi:acyl carrier protein
MPCGSPLKKRLLSKLNERKPYDTAMKESLAKYIATEFLHDPERAIAPEEALISSGLVDSFNLVDLALFIEDKYGVHLDDSELTADVFDNLDQLAELIASRQAV